MHVVVLYHKHQMSFLSYCFFPDISRYRVLLVRRYQAGGKCCKKKLYKYDFNRIIKKWEQFTEAMVQYCEMFGHALDERNVLTLR